MLLNKRSSTAPQSSSCSQVFKLWESCKSSTGYSQQVTTDKFNPAFEIKLTSHFSSCRSRGFLYPEERSCGWPLMEVTALCYLYERLSLSGPHRVSDHQIFSFSTVIMTCIPSATVWGSPTARKNALLIHGLTSSSNTWHKVASSLAAEGMV